MILARHHFWRAAIQKLINLDRRRSIGDGDDNSCSRESAPDALRTIKIRRIDQTTAIYRPRIALASLRRVTLVGCELPVDASAGGIALLLPCGDLAVERG